ncbi:MAG TPA: 30S ribosomal protein S9 [Candidatus Omnitrophica bacterium]|nr:MAG: 30S ribosomal protein S9 [Candidatus Omnitrophota bacterium]RKY34226.1 MAG: 30S ribosomal protein S9 [Candidatus Omnitrophota bacterium]RKY42354.1 MAG: 30S ribosomal protein S9 [Candidatus Omnitrophota bacterium]HEC69115.1 30S ribosomal protein S9 [Candidatus Omnitrophota bacterium]
MKEENTNQNNNQEKEEILSPAKILASGRRKEAVARVQLIVPGKGKFLINGKKWDEYFTTPLHRLLVKEPLNKANLSTPVDVKAKAEGGGITGQAGAIRLGLAKALVEYNPQLKSPFKREKLLTRDPRAKERKKYGRRGARRRFQWTKR